MQRYLIELVGQTRKAQVAIQRREITKRIFVRGFPDHCNKEQIEACMSEYGKVVQVALFGAPQARSSSALVTFADINSAFSAIDELQNTLRYGRRISVEFALNGLQMRGRSRDRRREDREVE